MDMKDMIKNNNIDWNKDMVKKLKHFPIVLHSNQWKKGTGLHYHPGLEFHMTHEGTGTMVVGKQIVLQSPRSVLVFRGMVPHQMISRSSYKRSVVSINFGDEDTGMLPSLHQLIEFAWIPNDSCLNFSLTPKQFLRMEEMVKELRHELMARGTGWEQVVLAQVLQMSVFLQRMLVEPEQVTALSSQPSGRKSDLVQQCSDFVCGNLGEDLSLKTVARRFAVSEAYLTRSFTKEMGISFYQYVLLQRVAEGKRLLREVPDVSISDIAYMIGFPSSSHFSRHFKLLTEETPSVYRQKMIDT
ncbi:helix-turn-helix domain-containing protein [Paenibacillus allorhizosphaerae]|nr:AraC family transcriptional regulator [Paenibacillus allorhizosphaerae]